jgi:CSLREA domain-containing protein
MPMTLKEKSEMLMNTLARVILVVVCCTLTARPASGAAAATLVVNTTADAATPGNGQCSLREAINNANTDSDTTGGDCAAGSGTDVITVPAGDYALNGQLIITSALTLNGASAGSTVIRNAVGQPNVLNDGDRVFNITGGAIVMNGLTIRDGDEPDGAGILNFANLTLNEVIVSDNYTIEDGAGTLNGSTGALVLNHSAVIFNTTGTPDGFAAGVENFGVLTATNTTIAGNRADNTAGGLFNAGTAFLDSVTVFSNTAGASGGGITNAGTLRLRNSLIAGNTAPTGPDCSGSAIQSLGHNLIQNTANCTITGTLTGNITGQDPLLGPLGNNGGPTPNAPLLVSSPAINTGTPADCPATDQRGVTRPQGTACDIGAFEFAKSNQTITFNPLPDRTLSDAPFVLTATASSGLAVTFSSQTPAVCTVAGSTVTLVTTSTCTLRASQAGDAAFNAAPDVERGFAVNGRPVFLPLIFRQAGP